MAQHRDGGRVQHPPLQGAPRRARPEGDALHRRPAVRALVHSVPVHCGHPRRGHCERGSGEGEERLLSLWPHPLLRHPALRGRQDQHPLCPQAGRRDSGVMRAEPPAARVCKAAHVQQAGSAADPLGRLVGGGHRGAVVQHRRHGHRAGVGAAPAACQGGRHHAYGRHPGEDPEGAGNPVAVWPIVRQPSPGERAHPRHEPHARQEHDKALPGGGGGEAKPVRPGETCTRRFDRFRIEYTMLSCDG
mmetsp:Transcript_12592/g.31775  ORF Transcript_12592/g.31775 Transcript_12592/m.31775 type:complete len:246 (+) Transcript_12592:228-965(+)